MWMIFLSALGAKSAFTRNDAHWKMRTQVWTTWLLLVPERERVKSRFFFLSSKSASTDWLRKLCGTSLQNALPRPSISFSHGNECSLGQILPSPLPPCNVVRKERLAEESSNIASGGGGGGGKGGASEYCSNSGKRHSVPHILARIAAQCS